MSNKSEEKRGSSNQDADLEIGDEELKKISGGVGAGGPRGARVAHRGNPIGSIGLRDNPFGGKR